MPEGTATFQVRAPIERVWAFVSDMRMIGGCVPGVQSVEILDETRARWNLKVKIGPLSQDIEVLTETLRELRESRAHADGNAEALFNRADVTSERGRRMRTHRGSSAHQHPGANTV